LINRSYAIVILLETSGFDRECNASGSVDTPWGSNEP